MSVSTVTSSPAPTTSRHPASLPTKAEISAALGAPGRFKELKLHSGSFEFAALLESLHDGSKFARVKLDAKRTAYVSRSDSKVYVYDSTPGVHRDRILRGSVEHAQAKRGRETVSGTFKLFSNKVQGREHVFNGGNVVGEARVTLSKTTSGYKLTVRITDPGKYLDPTKRLFTLSIPKATDVFRTAPGVVEYGHAEATGTGRLSAVLEDAGKTRRLSIDRLSIPRRDGQFQQVRFVGPDGALSGKNLLTLPIAS